MSERDELNAQMLNEEAVRIAARILAFAGVKQNQGPEIVYSNVREILEASLQEIERRGYGFDDAHPEGFDIMLEGLRDTIDDRLTKHEWPK
jgi:hypothetical protein